MRLTILILTFNEEVHLSRCLQSFEGLCCDFLIVDSFSSDGTVAIAESFNAKVVQNKFENFSEQIKLGLLHLNPQCNWVFRIDADEYIDLKMREGLKNFLKSQEAMLTDKTAFRVHRTITFDGRRLRFGGCAEVPVVRLVNIAFWSIDGRLMDEHFVGRGNVGSLPGRLVDNNLKSIDFWIKKHLVYSSYEALERFVEIYSIPRHGAKYDRIPQIKKLIKTKVYYRMPFAMGALVNFLFRYFILLGFLDGKSGFSYLFLQSFWYRFVVEIKIKRIRNRVSQGNTIEQAIESILGKKFKCKYQARLKAKEGP